MRTGAGDISRAISATEMRALEQRAISSGTVNGFELMCRAGRGVVHALMGWQPEPATTGWQPLILAGPGNNGGDGFIIAAELARQGLSPRVFSEPGLVRQGDAARAEALWCDHAEGPPIKPLTALPDALAGDVLVFDALFGTGLTRGVEGVWRGALESLSALPPRALLAVDLASGFDADTGRWLGHAAPPVRYGLTVSFHAAKTGHFLGALGQASEALMVTDIGLEPDDSGIALARPSARLAKSGAAHKYDHGHAVVLAGGVGRGGAARLAARAALRIGAGLVTLAPPPAALIENAARLDAVMLRPLRDATALTDWLAEDSRISALALGPGLGLDDRARSLVLAACAAKRALVLDADALTLFESAPQELFTHLHDRAVLTPHQGEFSRLFPDLAEDAHAGDKIRAVTKAAARAGATVLLKGADGVIASAAGDVRLCPALYDRACPWLATAGAGDVLTGLIAGALARGLAPLDAAASAAWLHQEAARRFGPGLIAEDLPEALPGVLAERLRTQSVARG